MRVAAHRNDLDGFQRRLFGPPAAGEALDRLAEVPPDTVKLFETLVAHVRASAGRRWGRRGPFGMGTPGRCHHHAASGPEARKAWVPIATSLLWGTRQVPLGGTVPGPLGGGDPGASGRTRGHRGSGHAFR
jgi:hypothetical protein